LRYGGADAGGVADSDGSVTINGNMTLSRLIAERRAHPTDDLRSGLAIGDDPAGRMGELIAGHETTVNLVANGMLTLLRHRAELERLRQDPERVPRVIEEVMRYELPVHFIRRYALADIDLAGVTSRQDTCAVLAGQLRFVTVHRRPLASGGLRRRVLATVPAIPRSCVPRVPRAARVRQPRRSLGGAAAWWRAMRRGVSTPVSMDGPARGGQGRTT
jgi:hypothetical protein